MTQRFFTEQILSRPRSIQTLIFSLNDAWKERWCSTGLQNLLFEFGQEWIIEFELPIRCLTNLNRLRTKLKRNVAKMGIPGLSAMNVDT